MNCCYCYRCYCYCSYCYFPTVIIVTVIIVTVIVVTANVVTVIIVIIVTVISVSVVTVVIVMHHFYIVIHVNGTFFIELQLDLHPGKQHLLSTQFNVAYIPLIINSSIIYNSTCV